MTPEEAIQISCDRGTCVIRIVSEDGFDLYKEALFKNRSFFEESIIENALAYAAADGYYCAVKGRKSIKDYLCGENTAGVELPWLLIRSLSILHDTCEKYGICFESIIFDYRAMYVNSYMTEMKFVYMPGAERIQEKRPSYPEVLKIVFLHVYNLLSDNDYLLVSSLIERELEKENSSLREKTRKAVFGEIEKVLAPYIFSKKQTIGTKIKKWVEAWLFSEKAPVVSDELCSNESVIALKGGETKKYIEILGDKRLEGIYLSRNICGDENNIIRIGRDKVWSDIVVEDMTASRQHAEISLESEGRLKIRDMSRNGIKVDGVRVQQKERTYDTDQDIRILITEDCGVLVRYKNA